jgi:hypothetical protein
LVLFAEGAEVVVPDATEGNDCVITGGERQEIVEVLCSDLAPKKTEDAMVERRPEYDDKNHELRWNGKVVWHWSRQADRQEVLVKAFAQSGWARIIDNPFVDVPAKRRMAVLRQTVTNLKRRLPSGTIRFSTNGHNQACWAPA